MSRSLVASAENRQESVRSYFVTLRSMLTLLNLHYAGVAILGLFNLYLLLQLGYAWQTASSRSPTAIQAQRVSLSAAEVAARPLKGLDQKLTMATEDANRFYSHRLPVTYSQVAGELGALAKKDGVKLTRVQYAQTPVLAGGAGALTEVRMDASLNGDYRSLVTYVNSLERDKTFFLIGGMTLTGQQSGTVGLRLGLTTYLRAPSPDDVPPQRYSNGTSGGDASVPEGGSRP